MTDTPIHTNALIRESSPYLRQHAHNPVQWLPWGDVARQKALAENKLMLVSIGYSACHWCHVMERECFEDEEVAALMNTLFVPVKVDREERPDVDQVYMEAVQAMSGQGGWPLNCFTTPDGKPIYGGTYYPKATWMRVLQQLSDMWREEPAQVQAYGDKLAAGMEIKGVIELPEAGPSFDIETLRDAVTKWKTRFDTSRGGPNKAPKFPLPSNYQFLLHYSVVVRDGHGLAHVERTLDAMGRGGIYDQVGGGFARYSVDAEWKVPHFEKMLYDNAQLMALYAEAYGAFRKKEYAETARGIKTWLQREMRNGAGGYFSALDADSEGVEGLFYTWLPEEVTGDTPLAQAFAKWYHTDHRALWEGRIIPVRKESFASAAEAHGKTVDDIALLLRELNNDLLSRRSARTRPATDDKTLCSWNAMLASAFAVSATYLNDPDDLREAYAIMAFIDTHMTDAESGELFHTWKDGKTGVEAFLEDYAFYIDACIKLYQADFEEQWLHKAKAMVLLVLDHFYDDQKGLFFFTHAQQQDLIVRPTELSDNVIPSSNAVMAHNLAALADYFGLEHMRSKATRLLHATTKAMTEYAEGYSCWADLHLKLVLGSPEAVVAGPAYAAWMQTLRPAHVQVGYPYHPLLLWAGAQGASTLPIFEGRLGAGVTRAFVCQHQSCLSPALSAKEAKRNIQKIYALN